MKTRLFPIVVVLTLALFIGAVVIAAPKSSTPKPGTGTTPATTSGTGFKIDKTKTAPFIPPKIGKEDEMDSIEECPSSLTQLDIFPSEDADGVIISWTEDDWLPSYYTGLLTAEVYKTSVGYDDIATAGEGIFCLYKVTGTDDPTTQHIQLQKTVADGWQCTVRDESSFNCEEI